MEAPVDITDARNLIVMRTNRNSLYIPNTMLTRHFAVTAIDRYGKESRATQSDHGRDDETDNTGNGMLRNSGNIVVMPTLPSTMDAELLIFESVTGTSITTKRLNATLNVKDIPDGMYILRTLNKKGKSHRLAWLLIKRM